MDYIVTRATGASQSSTRRKLCRIISLAMSLGLLIYFKYADFFLTRFGGACPGPVSQILLIMDIHVNQRGRIVPLGQSLVPFAML